MDTRVMQLTLQDQTIGIIICKDKKNTLVIMKLLENNSQILSAIFRLYYLIRKNSKNCYGIRKFLKIPSHGLFI
ncbi:MAG: DUF1016 domain-containing protein [Lachnospiraceae bacterium]|nr:DUF1016 domain-containing protein [Lachnospiraceae bacterium]